MTFVREPPSFSAPVEGERARFFAFRGQDLILQTTQGGRPLVLPAGSSLAAAGLTAARTLRIGLLDGAPAYLVELADDASLSPEHAALGMRQVLMAFVADQDLARAAGYASELLHWLRTSVYCPRCGQPVRAQSEDWGRRCPTCDFSHYPRVSPCVIVLIHDGPRVLLVRQPRFPAGMFGLVAGFVEPGESLEECLVREVAEEVGLRVTDLRYFRSQPWPFPHQLMVAFSARYAGGELVLDGKELAEGGWYPVDALPNLPPPISVARQLIDAYLAGLAG